MNYCTTILLCLITTLSNAQCLEGDCQNGYGVYEAETMIITKEGNSSMEKTRYSGFYKDGVYHGVGILQNIDGMTFKGAFVEGKKHGVGLTTMNGLTQYAEYEDGELHGYSFSTLSGELLEACKYKKGKFQKDLSQDYSNNIKGSGCLGNCVNAFGLKVYDDTGNNHYTGFFWAEMQQFVGIRQFGSGSRYSGAMKKSDRQGVGEYVWPDGQVYFGEWDKNEMHGLGILIEADGTEKFGRYKKGKFVESLR